jgi:hypothetical protein
LQPQIKRGLRNAEKTVIRCKGNEVNGLAGADVVKIVIEIIFWSICGDNSVQPHSAIEIDTSRLNGIVKT